MRIEIMCALSNILLHSRGVNVVGKWTMSEL
jgi:hypothetical protein